MVKIIKSEEDLANINYDRNVLIEYGDPSHCVPCKMTLDNLTELEKNNTFDIDYYECENIDLISNLGYNSIPVLVLTTKEKKVELNDSSVSMDENELSEWIKNNI